MYITRLFFDTLHVYITYIYICQHDYTIVTLKSSNFHAHLQILMNVRQHKLGTANTGVEIHWAHTNATAMKGIHCKRMNAKVSHIYIQCKLQNTIAMYTVQVANSNLM